MTGGGAMFLNDAVGRSGLQYVCNHHEQACAMAAEGYARITNRLGVASVTTGPGGINALNGVYGAWTDSVPLLVISGQVKRETCMETYQIPGLRQLGDQEVDIIPLAQPLTKYAVSVHKPEEIRFHLEKALYLATTGRKGPCWIDVPVDVQSAEINPEELTGYSPEAAPKPNLDPAQIAAVAKALIQAKRPLLMTGNGVRIAQAVDEMQALSKRLKIPVVTSWTSLDQMDSNDPLYFGRTGILGERRGNLALCNTDCLITLGSRLNIRQISYDWKNFAPQAFKVQVDIDPAELIKPTCSPNIAVQADVRDFIQALDQALDSLPNLDPNWVGWGPRAKVAFPMVNPQHAAGPKLNPYHFIDRLFAKLDKSAIVVSGNGSACVVPNHGATVKFGQRIFCNSGDASMGYDLPAALGAAFAAPGKPVICLAGDGSLMMNLQEIETLRSHPHLQLKLFIINNEGYLSIRQTQDGFFKGFRVGSCPQSGLSIPDFTQLLNAWGLPCQKADYNNLDACIDWALATSGPVAVEVMVDPAQPFEPKLASKRLPDGKMQSPAFDDMAPFLDRSIIEPFLFRD